MPTTVSQVSIFTITIFPIHSHVLILRVQHAHHRKCLKSHPDAVTHAGWHFDACPCRWATSPFPTQTAGSTVRHPTLSASMTAGNSLASGSTLGNSALRLCGSRLPPPPPQAALRALAVRSQALSPDPWRVTPDGHQSSSQAQPLPQITVSNTGTHRNGGTNAHHRASASAPRHHLGLSKFLAAMSMSTTEYRHKPRTQ